MPQRVLIVEDDSLQQAVIKAALERGGYDIEVASDGLTAVRMLRGGGFDLALIDYNLPEIDGLASARLVHDLMPETDRPKLIAVTAALDSLGSRPMLDGVFDAILPKPLNLPGLLAIIGTQLASTSLDEAARAATAAWRELGLEGAPSVLTMPAPTPAQAQLLRGFFDLSGRRPPEAVLLLAPEAARLAEMARAESPWFTLPFVGLAGELDAADADFSATDHSTWRAVASAIKRFREQRRLVANAALGATDIDTRLLIYLFLNGRPFSPVLASTTHECVRYPGFFVEPTARLAAERLAAAGLLARQFFERFHVCGQCGSSRLNARTECKDCQSADLREGPVVHHFGCGYQSVHAAFVNGPHLTCPRCREPLRAVGRDFGMSGHAMSCGGCGASNPERTVGLACLDCGGHTSAEAAETRDVYSYDLTPEGVARLGVDAWLAWGGQGMVAASGPERI